MGKLRLGVIGAGAWATASHLPNLARRADEIEFVAVSRLGAEPLETVRKRFGFAVASEDYRDVLDAGVDVCIVSSPGGLHYEHARAALEAGAHVLVEKPITTSSRDAWDLVRCAAELDRHLVCSFGYNFRPLLRQVKALYDEHGIGRVEQIAIRMYSFTRELLSVSGWYPRADPSALPEKPTWIDRRLSGGGYGQAQLSHALGAALWITGLRGEKAYASMYSPNGAAVEFHDAIVLQLSNAAIGTLTGGSSHLDGGLPEAELEIHVIGSEGHLSFEIHRGRAMLGRGGDVHRVDLGIEGGIYDCDGPPNALVDLALGRHVENCAPGELGARTVEILEAAYRSAETDAPVAIEAGA